MIPELTPVILTKNVLYSGNPKSRTMHRPGYKMLRRGLPGKVVAVHAGGSSYEVAFQQPYHCLITVQSNELEPVEPVRPLVAAKGRKR